jgi:uncharacterized protein (TIGR03437 family)
VSYLRSSAFIGGLNRAFQHPAGRSPNSQGVSNRRYNADEMRLALMLTVTAPIWSVFAWAQTQLVVTDDGAKAFFLASNLRPKGSDQNLTGPQGYSFSAAGLQLQPTGFPDPGVSLTSIAVSGDASLTAANGVRSCPPGGPFTLPQCPAGFERYQTVIRFKGGSVTLAGTTAFSSNGRFAVVFGQTGSNPTSLLVVDLTSGAQFTTGALAAAKGRFLTADGSVVVAKGDQLALVSPVSVKLSGSWSGTADSLWVDDSGSTIVYELGRKVHLRSRDGSDLILGPDGADSFGPSLSRDGKEIVFLSTVGDVPQVFISSRGGSARQLTLVPEGIREAVITGDGLTVFMLTKTGRLLRVAVQNPIAEQLLGPAFSVWQVGPLTPGSAVTVQGTFCSGNPRVSVDGLPAPVFAVASDTALFQVPWEIANVGKPATAAAVEASVVITFDSSPWEQVSSSYWQPFSPFLPARNMLHQDFGSLVTQQHPGIPGEIVHLFGTGLGPVDQPVQTGAPSPSLSPARITTDCQWVDALHDERPLEVLFAGLAPTLIGQYQIDLRFPNISSGPPAVGLACRSGGRTFQVATVPAALGTEGR